MHVGFGGAGFQGLPRDSAYLCCCHQRRHLGLAAVWPSCIAIWASIVVVHEIFRTEHCSGQCNDARITPETYNGKPQYKS